jgi:hypothetical protein
MHFSTLLKTKVIYIMYGVATVICYDLIHLQIYVIYINIICQFYQHRCH